MYFINMEAVHTRRFQRDWWTIHNNEGRLKLIEMICERGKAEYCMPTPKHTTTNFSKQQVVPVQIQVLTRLSQTLTKPLCRNYKKLLED